MYICDSDVSSSSRKQFGFPFGFAIYTRCRLGFLTTTAGAIAADLIPDERRGEGTGYYATAMNVAMAIGPFLGIFISAHANFK